MKNSLEIRLQLVSRLKNISLETFDDLALDIFRFQAQNNEIYSKYLGLLKQNVDDVNRVEDIPFLPIELFKFKRISTLEFQEQIVFSSSGTTSSTSSKHFVRELNIYKYVSKRGFEKFFGNLTNYCFFALLPAYLERTGSSLIYMIDYFIEKSECGGFYLYNHDELIDDLKKQRSKGKKVVLFGVSFALLDLVETQEIDLSDVIIVETGGMKGRRKEITREELHNVLIKKLGVNKIHSEYGMTELLSQAWSKGDGIFYPSDSMKIFIREMTDPFSIIPNGKSGVINIIDLGNIDSCSFIATDDIGRKYDDNSFEILGRLDVSDIRGCNLMVQDIE